MEEIKHSYTIQWVGSFKSYKALQDHKRKAKFNLTSDSGLFSFYYFRRNKKWQRGREFSYFGKHSGLKSILDRLNRHHEHFKNFHENENLEIWIGSFSCSHWQSPEIIDLIETLFIQRYKLILNENSDKKAKPMSEAIAESIVVVNLWYDTNEMPYRNRNITPFDDVIVFEKFDEDEAPRLLGGQLRKKSMPDY